MKNKVVLFGPYPPPYGGVSIYVDALYKLLSLRGFDCELIPYSIVGEKSIRPGFTSIWKNFYKLKKSDSCVDSCSFFFEYPSVNSSIAWFLVKSKKRFRWIKIFHDGTLSSRYDSFSFLQKIFFCILIKHVNEIVVVSDEIGKWLQNRIKVKQRISLIQSLLPLTPEIADDPLPIEIDRALARNEKVICSIGAFTQEYGFKNIADSVEKIRGESGRDIGLILIDASFSRDEEYKSEITKRREWISVFENIPRSQVLQILRISDVFIRGFKFESYGLSRIESIWCGTPVVATTVGETRGMLLYDFGDEAMLRTQIKEALFNPSIQIIQMWAEVFQREAESNLQQILKLLSSSNGGDS